MQVLTTLEVPNDEVRNREINTTTLTQLYHIMRFEFGSQLSSCRAMAPANNSLRFSDGCLDAASSRKGFSTQKRVVGALLPLVLQKPVTRASSSRDVGHGAHFGAVFLEGRPRHVPARQVLHYFGFEHSDLELEGALSLLSSWFVKSNKNKSVQRNGGALSHIIIY